MCGCEFLAGNSWIRGPLGAFSGGCKLGSSLSPDRHLPVTLHSPGALGLRQGACPHIHSPSTVGQGWVSLLIPPVLGLAGPHLLWEGAGGQAGGEGVSRTCSEEGGRCLGLCCVTCGQWLCLSGSQPKGGGMMNGEWGEDVQAPPVDTDLV